jgi:YihY family inner membrane protein
MQTLPDMPAYPSPAPLNRPDSRRRVIASAGAFWRWLLAAGNNFSQINGTTWSASFAYYAFFALFPLLLLLVTIGTDVAARFVGEQHAATLAFNYIVGNVERYMPMDPQDRQTIRHTVQGVLAARGQIGLVALLGFLWSSLGFFQALVSAINQAWGDPSLAWWKLPLKNLTMLGVLLSAFLLGVLAPAILNIVERFLTFGTTWVPALFALAGVLIPTLVLFYGFLLFYKLAPRRRNQVTFVKVWIPALLVTALLQLCQRLFVFYSTHITNFNAVYGTFGGVIALMLWIYLSGLVIVFGGSLCATLSSRTAEQAPGTEDGRSPAL